MREVKIQFEQCDGHAFFTDMDSKGPAQADIVKVKVPKQREPRSSKNWLYHRNMVGLLPSWTYLLTTGMAEKYDWVINSELDHFLIPSRARLRIIEKVKKFRSKKWESGPVLMMWGNAFVFNRNLVQMMRLQWPKIGRAANLGDGPEEKEANGCPASMKGKQEWPQHCSQDIFYPECFNKIIHGRVMIDGKSGCGQSPECFEISSGLNPGDGQNGTIKELALMQRMSPEEAQVHWQQIPKVKSNPKQFGKYWQWFYNRSSPVLIHHATFPSTHKLARELLVP